MKRLLLCMSTISLLLLVLVGCSKDEVQPVSQQQLDSQLLSEQEKTLEPKTLDTHLDGEELTSEPSKEVATENDSNQSEEPSSTSEKEDHSTDSEEKTTEQPSTEDTNTSDSKPTPTTTSKPEEKPAPKPTNTLKLSVETGDIQGTLFPLKEVEVRDGDTVIDVTKRALGDRVHPRGSGATTYVEGFDNLYEFDHGALSGWLVKVDGVFITSSSGSYPAKKGQKIEWIYATDITTMIEEG